VPDPPRIIACMWHGKPVPRDPLVSHGVGREVHAQQDGGRRAETARDTGGDRKDETYITCTAGVFCVMP
jgi:hypothetical protein